MRNIIMAVCGLVVVISLAVFAATGAKPFSRHPDPELAQTNETDDLEALFADESDMEVQDTPRVKSEFAFGLLPGGPEDMLSVAVFAGPAFAVAAGAFLLERRSRKSKAAPPEPDKA